MAVGRPDYQSTGVIEPLRLEIAPWPKAPDLRKGEADERSNISAAARKPLAVKSELEAEISSLLEQESQKPPDDGERIRSLVARLTSNSIDELEGLGSDLTSAVRELQEFLKSEGERVQREIVNYAHLTETTLAAIKTIIETTFRPAHRATSTWVDSKRAP